MILDVIFSYLYKYRILLSFSDGCLFVSNRRELQLPAVLLLAIKTSRYHPFISHIPSTVQTKMQLQNVTGFVDSRNIFFPESKFSIREWEFFFGGAGLHTLRLMKLNSTHGLALRNCFLLVHFLGTGKWATPLETGDMVANHRKNRRWTPYKSIPSIIYLWGFKVESVVHLFGKTWRRVRSSA